MSLIIKAIQSYSKDYIATNAYLSDETIKGLNIPEELKNHITYLQYRHPIKAALEYGGMGNINFIERLIEELSNQKKGSEFHDLIDTNKLDEAYNTLIQLHEDQRIEILKIKDADGNNILEKIANLIVKSEEPDSTASNMAYLDNFSYLFSEQS